MSWGGLNNALTAWRNGVMARFPDKDAASDGARADAAHASTSQHQPDSDDTVDAYDMDVNLFKGSPASGTPVERALIEALKADFQLDRRSRLWIHDREIASDSIGPWRVRDYYGDNPHDKHVHWESEQAYEDDGRPWSFRATDALLERMRDDGMSVQDVRDFFKSAADGVTKPTAEATSQNRADRNSVAQVIRWAMGINFADQETDKVYPLLVKTHEAVIGLEDPPPPPPGGGS